MTYKFNKYETVPVRDEGSDGLIKPGTVCPSGSDPGAVLAYLDKFFHH